MSKALTVSIMQSNYIPWKGYFDLARCSDVFVFLDTVQYTKNDWRNRNQIVINKTPAWLTIPVQTKGKFGQRICDVAVAQGWANKHYMSISQAYAKAPFFKHYKGELAILYQACNDLSSLSEVNRLFFDRILKWLNINVDIQDAANIETSQDPNQRILDIIQHVGGKRYISGPSAKSYLNESLFRDHGIEVIWADYSHYPEHPQQSNIFCHYISILDLIFNVGPDATKFLCDIKSEIKND